MQDTTPRPPEKHIQDQLPEPIPPPPKPLKPAHKFPTGLVAGIAMAMIVATAAFLILRPRAKEQQSGTDTGSSTTNVSEQATVQGLQLDPNKNYGDKYKDGILPVGDNQYSTSAASKGKVYLCNANFVPSAQAGAQTRGSWFIGTTQWDINKKYAVSGSVNWKQQISVKIDGSTRVVTTNDLPDHPTGVFPVATNDPAYQYDRNPNTIKEQSLTYNLSANPTYGTPQCMDGEVGLMLTGAALFNAFDAGGRDAGAWEIQDSCEGHPQSSGLYHYHTLSSCIKDIGVGDVIGFSLDGFPITGPKVGTNNYLTTDDLDECHGITSEITLDSKKVATYHYVMTQDFPYSVSCFRAKPIQSPGQHSGSQSAQQTQPSTPPPPQQPPPRPRPY